MEHKFPFSKFLHHTPDASDMVVVLDNQHHITCNLYKLFYQIPAAQIDLCKHEWSVEYKVKQSLYNMYAPVL